MDGHSMFFPQFPGRASAAARARSTTAPETRGTAKGHEVGTVGTGRNGFLWMVVDGWEGKNYINSG